MNDEMKEEYNLDFSQDVRGKYAERMKDGYEVHLVRTIELDPDLETEFPDSASVNRALRAYIEVRRIVAEPPGEHHFKPGSP